MVTRYNKKRQKLTSPEYRSETLEKIKTILVNNHYSLKLTKNI